MLMNFFNYAGTHAHEEKVNKMKLEMMKEANRKRELDLYCQLANMDTERLGMILEMMKMLDRNPALVSQGVFGNDDRFDPIGQTAQKCVR
jgi:hypothetical protein